MIGWLVAFWNGLPNWARTLVKRAAFSSLLLATVSYVATHWYAMTYGARIPLEGVPFLIALSVIASFLLTLISLSTLILIPLGKNYESVAAYRERIYSGDRSIDHPDGALTRIYFAAMRQAEILIRTMAFVLILIGVALAAASAFVVYAAWERGSAISAVDWFVIVTPLPVIAFLVFALLNRLTMRSFEQASLLIYVVSVTALVFGMLGPLFDHVLRATRYGGGVAVEVSLNEGRSVQVGSLFLVSSDTVTLWSCEDDRFYELNADIVDHIAYMPNPVWTLPEPRSWSEITMGTAGEVWPAYRIEAKTSSGYDLSADELEIISRTERMIGASQDIDTRC